MEVRCSTDHSCGDQETIQVDVACPNAANALGLNSLFAVDDGGDKLRWLGSPLDVDVWTSSNFSNSSSLAGYAGTTFFAAAANEINLGTLNPGPGQAVGILVKANGALNTLPDGTYGFYCNSRTWRSGAESEIPESGYPTSSGRDTAIGDPTP